MKEFGNKCSMEDIFWLKSKLQTPPQPPFFSEKSERRSEGGEVPMGRKHETIPCQVWLYTTSWYSVLRGKLRKKRGKLDVFRKFTTSNIHICWKIKISVRRWFFISWTHYEMVNFLLPYDTYIEFVPKHFFGSYKHFLQTLRPKSLKNVSKKLKNSKNVKRLSADKFKSERES